MKKLLRIFGVIAGIGFVVWLARDRLAGPVPVEAPTGDIPRFRAPPPAQEPAPGTGAATDDLSVIKGIGPVYQERLAEAGITSLAGLAAADPVELAGRLDLAESRVRRWVGEAKPLAGT
ncbi:MAG: helix-hairpin-helix domain-containing protein [Acidimicrobiia bacterium]